MKHLYIPLVLIAFVFAQYSHSTEHPQPTRVKIKPRGEASSGALKLRQGDTLTGVNDTRLDTPGAGLEAFQKLKHDPNPEVTEEVEEASASENLDN